MVIPSFKDFCEKAKKGNLIPVYREILADTETPVSAFLKIKEGNYGYLLESVEGGEKWGRYSFLGTAPSVVVKGEGHSVSIIRNGKCELTTVEGNPLLVLKRVLAEYRPVEVEGLPRFFGGAVGTLGYDMVRFFEPLHFKKGGRTMPDFFFMLTDTLLLFDNVKHRIKVISNAFIGKDDLKVVYERAIEKIDALIRRLAQPLPAQAPAPGGLQAPVAAPKSNFTRDQYKKAVLSAKEYIKAGDIFQVQISQRFSSRLKAEPFMVYRALRSINPSPYMFYLHMGERHMVGTSPEVLVRLEGERVELRPIAGTRPRGQSPEEDLSLEKELLADPKERAEHVMLIDLGRNDVGRVCQYGTVKVDEVMVIERYSHVMHIVSNVIGKLLPGKDAFDVLSACFPAGTVTGAPKIRAMEIIDELEPEGRSLYAGAVGYFSYQGNMDTCITIRTIVIEGDVATIQAAAGIVADSDPDREYEETMNKARAMLEAISLAERGLV
ncbi:MAG: anthranilate synthase component I [Nitrospira sp.]|nr:anthranilate synthase component I [Candidatus Manganitrophaceae bacterium]HIL35411.1 anthranilate synthase component I [Candidatus Manganitrophaceae bacterium]